MSDETVSAQPTETTTSTSTEQVTSTTKEPTKVDATSLKSDQIKDLINNPPKIEPQKTEGQEASIQESNKEEWFDKERGFKTAEDMRKSYAEAQNAIREKSEKLKQLEDFRVQAEQQLQALNVKASSAPLSPEDAQKQAAIKQWQEENRESLDFIKNLVKDELKKEEVHKSIESRVISERKAWKEEFDKDESRRALWPKMEEVYQKHGQKMFENPFIAIEAIAFKENFASIADKIKQEAVEQYKASLKQAAEAEKAKRTAIPGGVRQISGDVDVSKMSSTDLAAMLPRSDS